MNGSCTFENEQNVEFYHDKTKNDQVNKEEGGLYIISDLCHYITAKETFTKLNLIRDSFGRDGSPTNGKTS